MYWNGDIEATVTIRVRYAISNGDMVYTAAEALAAVERMLGDEEGPYSEMADPDQWSFTVEPHQKG